MNIEELKAQYRNYSDEKLFYILTRDREGYTEIAIQAAEAVLKEKGRNVDTWLNEMRSLRNEEEDIYSAVENLTLKERLDFLTTIEETREAEEIKIQAEENSMLDNDALLQQYLDTMQNIIEQKKDNNKILSRKLKSFMHIHDLIIDREIKIPSDKKEIQSKTIDIIFQKNKRKATASLIIGALALLAGIYFTMLSDGQILFYGAILAGLAAIINGLKILNLMNRFKQNIINN